MGRVDGEDGVLRDGELYGPYYDEECEGGEEDVS